MKRVIATTLILLAARYVVAAEPAGDTFLRTLFPATGWLTSLRHANDPDRCEFIRQGETLGEVRLRVRVPGGEWRDAVKKPQGVDLQSTINLCGEALRWEIRVDNHGGEAVEIGDLALPLPMNTDYVADHEETFNRRVIRHAFISGNGSFLYWLPVKGTGPILVMMPEGDTRLEYFTADGMDYASGKEHFTAYIHAKASAEANPRGTWRQPLTGPTLQPGDQASYVFSFYWADSYDGVRALLRQHGGVDVQVAPSMVVPRGQDVRLALATHHDIDAVTPEFPDQTAVSRMGERRNDTSIYQIRFSKLGENLLTVRYGGGRSMTLEFFVTEPLETLIRKRARFIMNNQQHCDPEKWYDGLFSLWDRRQPPGKNLLGPDRLAGQPPYAVSGSDDPSNCKCLLLAEKNVAFPNPEEIAALEYFIKNFVWGKQQRTDKEKPYPYGIYGSDSWQQNRNAERDPLDQGVSRPGGPSACRMWRTFDYPTYFALYFNMYRIAKQRPQFVNECDAATYLERAFGTALAYFEVPAHIRMDGGWSFTGWVYWQYTVGNFHEKYLLPLMAALAAEGHKDQAEILRAEWEKKVKYFIYDNPWPFASEMPIDSTAYESTYAAANYAIDVPMLPDKDLWQDANTGQSFSHPKIDPKRHQEFLLRQHLANLACRGVLESHYWSLGSDFRGCGSASYTLSYMSQIGGWAVLDYALRHDPNPAANLRLGYASMLSSWALMNTGDADSNYGYWTPGQLHDGAMSWGFQPRRVGSEWNPAIHDLPRGAWPVCGEADHGLVAAIEAARTVLFDDPLFGLFAYGGDCVRNRDVISVVPRDGVRQRFSALLGKTRLHLEWERDGFQADKAIELTAVLDVLRFSVENRSGGDHSSQLRIEGLPAGTYAMAVNGEAPAQWLVVSGPLTLVPIQIAAAATTDVSFTRTKTEPKPEPPKAPKKKNDKRSPTPPKHRA